MAPTNLHFDSSSILKEQSSANVIVEMPGRIDGVPSRPCSDDSLGVKTLNEATQTVRDLLAGRSQEIEIVSSIDMSIRKAVAGELLGALSRPNIEEREHARQLFIDHGYLDDAMRVLDSTGLPNERAMAARALGLIASPRGIMSLVEALLDDASEVRHAAEQALAQISGPVVADLGALLEEELNLAAAEVVESIGTPTTVAFQETPFKNLTIEERKVQKPMSEATDVRASTICLEEEAFQKAMRELKHRLFDAEDLTLKRNALVQKAMEELEDRLLEAEELTRKRIELEAAQRAEVYAARRAEAEQALRELEEQREKELALLRSEANSFQQDLEVVAEQRARVEETRLEAEAEIQRLGEEKVELAAAMEARRAGVGEVRFETEARIRLLDEEKAELEAALEARRAGVKEVSLETEAQIRRLDEEKAELEAALEARRAGVEEVRLETETQIRRLDEEKAELEAAVEARQAEVERLHIEAERQLSEAENRSRAEREQFLRQTADLERITEEVAHRRAEVEASLHKANEEDEGLLEMQRATQQMRLETEAQIRRLDEEKAELEAAVKARLAEAARLCEAERELSESEDRSRAELRRLDREKAELEAAVEARLAELERLRIEAERQLSEAENRSRTELRRLDEEKAELQTVVEARLAEVERLCQVERELSEAENGSRIELQRLDEEKVELEAAVEARQAEVERLRIEALCQLGEAENRSRAEQEQLLQWTADLERVTEEVAHRRAEVAASLHKANEEDVLLLEMQEATEPSRQPAAVEVLWLEPEICERTYIDQRLLEETRLRAQDQQQLIEEEARRGAEEGRKAAKSGV